jgi:hypothetical protein
VARNRSRWLWVAGLCATTLSACTTLTAPDEAKSLEKATANLAAAIRDADAEQTSALLDFKREESRLDMARGGKVAFNEKCASELEKINDEFEDVLTLPHNSAVSDKIFRKIRLIEPCGIKNLELVLPTLPEPEPIEFETEKIGSIGQSSLSKAARQIEAYTASLADIATGESSGKVDAAQAKLVAAGKGLLSTAKIGTPSDAILDLVAQAISSVVAAKRNKTTRDFLNKYDRAVPIMMERLGTGARFAILQAASNRTRAAESLSEHANRSLNAKGMVTMRGRDRIAVQTRIDQYDDIIARLDSHNASFLALRKADPMIAARAFAESHRALRDIYNDPKASRAALAEGLAKFTESAAAVKEALNAADH